MRMNDKTKDRRVIDITIPIETRYTTPVNSTIGIIGVPAEAYILLKANTNKLLASFINIASNSKTKTLHIAMNSTW